MTLTSRIRTCVKDLIHWSQKNCYLSDNCPKSEMLKLNFSMEKSKFEPVMLLYRFFLTARLGIYMCQIF